MAASNREQTVTLKASTTVAPPTPWHRNITPEKILKYSTNWNGKLNCRFHTTIRLQKGYYKQGDLVQVKYAKQPDNEYLFKGYIIKTTEIKLNQLTEVFAYLDTGHSLAEAKAIFQKMYPGTDWQTQTLVLLLIENLNY